MRRFIFFVFTLLFVLSMLQLFLVGDVSMTSLSDILSYIQRATDNDLMPNIMSSINSWQTNVTQQIYDAVADIPVLKQLAFIFVKPFELMSFLANGLMSLLAFIVQLILPLFT